MHRRLIKDLELLLLLTVDDQQSRLPVGQRNKRHCATTACNRAAGGMCMQIWLYTTWQKQARHAFGRLAVYHIVYRVVGETKEAEEMKGSPLSAIAALAQHVLSSGKRS